MKYNIGVIGCGFVGSAVAAGFSLHVNSIKLYDTYKTEYDSLDDTVNNSNIIFVCVPTPTTPEGKQDLTHLTDALQSIVDTANDSKVIVIKSTVLPGTSRRYQEYLDSIYNKTLYRHKIVYNPEFLSARTARFDFINPARIILGGDSPTHKTFTLISNISRGITSATQQVANLYRHRFGEHVPIFRTSWEIAELVKYTANSFFAMKIAFCNQIYDIAENLNIDYNAVKELWLMDGKVARSHCDVPGHDGSRGYGGACFPKDVLAFITWAKEQNYDLEILETVHNSNTKIRGN
jgi:UDPglucose 6-dehydrogenase